jgi:hypothetical protein
MLQQEIKIALEVVSDNTEATLCNREQIIKPSKRTLFFSETFKGSNAPACIQ